MTNDLSKNVWQADLKNGYYKNPILFADYSDPDVARVGDDYYMVASSFNYIPGLPVLHSKDLVNWEVISYVVDRLPFPNYNKPEYGKGVWAPSIRYHDGKLWVFFATPDEGIFMSTTTDPHKGWQPLTHVKKTKGWIDTCPFWDDDGNAYIVSAFAKSRIGFKSILHLSRMKPDGTALLDEGEHIFDGNLNHPTIEGPKMYKRNGYYYIFAPAGGVKPGWQTVLRSKNIYGPYEDRIVLHQGGTEVNGPHQGGWVDTKSGQDWFIHFQDRDAYGRITHLQPMQWVDDWPVMGKNVDKDGIGEPVETYKKPDVGATFPIKTPATSDDFDKNVLGLQWQWNANPQDDWYSFERQGFLRLFALNNMNESGLLFRAPNVLTQLFQAPNFSASVKVEFSGQNVGDKAGFVILGEEYTYVVIEKTQEGNKISCYYGSHSDAEYSEDAKYTEQLIDSQTAEAQTVIFSVDVKYDSKCSFKYSYDGKHFKPIGKAFIAKPGRWVGAKLGIFAMNKYKDSNGFADIDWIYVK
ncbi:MAG TPA: glycoside hydrolase 43 family protein [Thermoclostridium sp.]|nr:glycoside hydrolase 43 family protein [Thermoclostridium sp.]